MRARNVNLIILFLLLSSVGLLAYKGSSRPDTPEAASKGSESVVADSELEQGLEGESQTIYNRKVLPTVVEGLQAAPDGHLTGFHLSVRVGETDYSLGDDGLVSADSTGKRKIPFANPEASHFSGLTYDSKRGRLALCSYGGSGTMEFYDLKSQAWLPGVDLDNQDVMGLCYWPTSDKFCSLPLSWGDDGCPSELVWWTAEGKPDGKTPLSVPLLLGGDLEVEIDGQTLKVLSSGATWEVDLKSGEVSGDFKKRYLGEKAALVTVYEASSDHTSNSDLHVTVKTGAPETLVLNSYEGVNWHIQGGDQLKKIIVSGYETSKVVDAPCRVEEMSYEATGKHLPIAHEIQSSDMYALLQELEGMGIGVESIACAYQAQKAVVE